MLKINSKLKKVIPATLACATLATVAAPFSSYAAVDNKNIATVTNQEFEQDVQVIANDLQFIFETASTKENGKYVLNEGMIEDKYGKESLPAIKVFVKMMNEEAVSVEEIKNLQNPSEVALNGNAAVYRSAYVDCIVNKVIQFTGIGFLTGGIKELISRSAWDLVAKELAKIVGKNALKGGIVGMAASLAWFAIACK